MSERLGSTGVPEKDFSTLVHGTVQVIPLDDFKKKLALGRRLVIKLGVDPTAPDLHLGHAVVLSKLREFQDAGHDIVFLIGDFTARIGDPTGRSKTRPPLSKEIIQQNVRTYLEQVGRILDRDKIRVEFNSSWLDVLSADDVIRLCSMITVARILERDDFKKRLQENAPISFHELLYPIFQAFDSVQLRADVELGGTDQTFNLLCGRFLQEQCGQEPQVVMTMPLLEGLDGAQKMSKSYHNYIGLTDEPKDVFGKVMSISDDLMWRYYGLLLSKSERDIADLKASGTHPKELKKQLAYGIISKFWSEQDAQDAQHSFEAVFEHKDYNQAQKVVLPDVSPLWIIDLLKYLGAIVTSSEGRRLIQAGAVQVDHVKILDVNMAVELKEGLTVRVGKHRIYQLVNE
jgi:tyrosyl-tRNA synthetase